MKTCICAVIKNEHQYLDEWIQYHLNLGIDYIFIFEDIDSDSHKDITDAYEKVSLHSVNILLNEKQKEEALYIKQTKRYNILHLYCRNALLYIKNLNIYDWCFIIDIDEFVTLENENETVNNILSLYNNYDALVLSWKCYGANNIINMPSYKDKGVIDTYTKEMVGYVDDVKDSLIKTCHNLKKYKPEYFYNLHHLKNISNWVNCEFKKDLLYKPCYKNMFIRHYITKSWEEYTNKLNQRGFLWGGARDYELFFKINPELLEYKNNLVLLVKQQQLVILPYKDSGSQGNELYLALSLWKKFCKFNYKFIVIGLFNDNIEKNFPWVEFIHCPKKEKIENQYNPHLDIQYKMELIHKRFKNTYDGFIWMVDDNYAIKPFNLEDIKTIHYHSLSFNGQEFKSASHWNHDKWKTRLLLDRENLPHVNYTIHYPCYFEFKKLKEIWYKFNMQKESYVLEDIYFNYYQHEEPILDSKIRLGIWNYNIYKNEFQKALNNPNIKFVCNSVEGWSKDLENDLRKLVEEPK